MKMLKLATLFGVPGVLIFAAGVVSANDDGPSLPDGPVEGPPGYICESVGGSVICRPEQTR